MRASTLEDRLETSSMISDVSIALNEETGILQHKLAKRKLNSDDEEYSGLDEDGPVTLRGDEERRRIREEIN
jgi:hypothetical protein